MRRGTSKAVPVVVSAGLAVGVFCGLLFGVGTGKKDAVASPAKGNNVKAHSDDIATTPVTPGETQNKIVPTNQIQVKGMGSNVVVLNGSGAGSAAGSGAGSGAVAMAGSAAGATAGSAAAASTIKLTVAVAPDAAAKTAKIKIDGNSIDGNNIDLKFEPKKKVKIEVTADGFQKREQTVDLLDGDMTVQLELVKKSGGSPGFGGTDTHRPTVPTRPPGGDSGTKKKKPGGLIDI